MKNFKDSGITLVALVITVIILLILAGVGISLISESGTGLFGKTREAAEKYNNAAQEEKNLIDNLVEQTKDKAITYEEYMKLMKNNAIGFPNYSDSNRSTISSGVEYTAEDNLWLIVNSVSGTEGSLHVTIDNVIYVFCQGYTNVDWSVPSQSMIPIKKGSKYKVSFSSGMTVYRVGMTYKVDEFEKETFTKEKVGNIVKNSTIGFPKYNDANRTTIVSGTEYIAENNMWLISVPVINSDCALALTVNGISYNFSKGYSGIDYSHPTHSIIPIQKGDKYKLTFSGTTVYKLEAEYVSEESENKILESTEISDIISNVTIGFPKYNQENRTTITHNQEYVVDENIWLVASSNSSGAGSIVVTVDGTTYSFYQGYSGTDYTHASQSMIPIKKGSKYKVQFGNYTIYKLKMNNRE